MQPVSAHGNPNCRLMVVGESPIFGETKAYTHRTHTDTMAVLKAAKVPLTDLWWTYVCKYFVTPNPAKGRKIPFTIRAQREGVDFQKCVEDLWKEITQIQPNAILALNRTALYALTGKNDLDNFRGSILRANGYKVIPTYQLSGLEAFQPVEFKGYYNKYIVQHDIERAWKQAQFKEYNPPTRTLTIARSLYEVENFISRYAGYKNPAVDIEARGKYLPDCVGISFTPKEGIAIPLWNHEEMNSIAIIPDSQMVQIWILLAKFLASHDVVGQNFKYDADKLIRLGFTVRSLYSDLLLKSFTISPELPKKLSFHTSWYTEEPYYKDEGMYEGAYKDLLIGCARDACVTKECDLGMDAEIDALGMRDWYTNFVMKLHDFYWDIDNEGFFINYRKRDELYAKYIAWSEALQFELWQIVGEPININSPKQVAILLYHNWKIPARAGTGEEEITAILNLQSLKLSPEQRRGLEIILEKRRVDKTIGTYLAALPDYDGKMRTTYFPCLDTGRSATTQLEPPIRPPVIIKNEKGEKKEKYLGTAFQTMTKHGDIGADVREQYEAAPGYVLLGADSAQAEARVVFLLADDEEALHDIDTRDYHAWTASWFFGGTEETYSKKVLGYEHPIRFVGKTLRHAGHLGASKKRAALTVNTDARKFKIDIKVTESFCGTALSIFHRKQPKIQGVFQNGIVECLQKNQRILRSGVPFGVDSKFGGTRQFLDRWGEELNRQAFSYIPQRSVSDNTKNAGMRVKQREPELCRIIMEAHDGLLFMVPEREVEYFAAIVKEEMERPIRFDTCSIPRRDLVIPCELEIGNNYYDAKKYKVKA